MSELSTLPPAAANRQWALLQLGFRPFYLMAGLFAIIAVPIWIAAFSGIVQLRGYLTGATWHSHEMIFGFAVAVIAGFLLTAVRNWTGRSTPTGAGLAGLACLWTLGRVLAFTGPAGLAAVVDLAFLPALGIALAIPIIASRDRRNIKILFVLVALTLSNVVFHLGNLNVLPASLAPVGTTVSLDVIAILIAIVAGRVIPAFTDNAIPSAHPQRSTLVEFLALGSLILVLLADALTPAYAVPRPAWVGLFYVAALAHLLRWSVWCPHRTVSDPLLLMLPMAYLWIPAMLALRGLAAAGIVPPTASVHALTLGAMSGLMIAMMMRSTLGHTGRPLRAGGAEVAAFVLIQTAALVRTGSGIVETIDYRIQIAVSGSLWILAFVVFIVRYGPMLLRPRIDGCPG